MSGGDLQDVAKISVIEICGCRNRYAHLSSAHLGAAVSRLDSIFELALAELPALTGDAPEAGQGSGHATVTLEPNNRYKPVLNCLQARIQALTTLVSRDLCTFLRIPTNWC